MRTPRSISALVGGVLWIGTVVETIKSTTSGRRKNTASQRRSAGKMQHFSLRFWLGRSHESIYRIGP